MRRFVVVGTSGSGKSTFANALAERLGVPHVELDGLYHRPNWTHVTDAELIAQIDDALDRDGWVVDGNYSSVRRLTWGKADAIVWLDYPKWFVMQRMVRRSLARGLTRRELWHGNTERLRNLVKRDPDENIVLWAWKTHEQNRTRYDVAFSADEWCDKVLMRFKRASAARAFLVAIPDPPRRRPRGGPRRRSFTDP